MMAKAMKNFKVAKFGGTSMADADAIEKVCEIIRKDKSKKVIVVSAPGKRFAADKKITDMLYESIENPEILQDIQSRFNEIIHGLGIPFDLENEFDVIKNNLKNGCSPDYIASRGEYLTAKIFAVKTGYAFLDASELFQFKNSKFSMKNTEKTIKKQLNPLFNVIVPGFYGSNENGEIVTFSRGGSDFSGAVLAGALQAKTYENWTDVDGVFMCNPGIVKNPKKLDSMTYDELRELSYMGANVLHHDCVFPLKKSETKIHILNTFNEKSTGTVIGSDRHSPKKLTGISGIKNLVKITVIKKQHVNRKQCIRETLKVFEKHNILLEFALVGIDSCSFIVRPDFCLEDVRAEIEKLSSFTKVELESGISTIVIIGGKLNQCPNILESIFSVLCKEKIKLKFINFNEGGNVFIGVANHAFERCIRRLYKHFKIENNF